MRSLADVVRAGDHSGREVNDADISRVYIFYTKLMWIFRLFSWVLKLSLAVSELRFRVRGVLQMQKYKYRLEQ